MPPLTTHSMFCQFRQNRCNKYYKCFFFILIRIQMSLYVITIVRGSFYTKNVNVGQYYKDHLTSFAVTSFYFFRWSGKGGANHSSWLRSLVLNLHTTIFYWHIYTQCSPHANSSLRLVGIMASPFILLVLCWQVRPSDSGNTSPEWYHNISTSLFSLPGDIMLGGLFHINQLSSNLSQRMEPNNISCER